MPQDDFLTYHNDLVGHNIYTLIIRPQTISLKNLMLSVHLFKSKLGREDSCDARLIFSPHQ